MVNTKDHSRTEADERNLSIAVVGGGVAGIVAAYLLQEGNRVTLFEGNSYLGGHTHTVAVPAGPDVGTMVDTGFIVLNDRTYPLLRTFLNRLGVRTRDTGMSFSYYNRATGFFYSGKNLNGLFAQRSNLFRPAFWSLLREIRRFCMEAEKVLHEGGFGSMTLFDYLRHKGYSGDLSENYIYPMCSAIWSSPYEEVQQFPAEPLMNFFRNHGLLSLKDRPQWMTVEGGSRSYVDSFFRGFTGSVELQTPIRAVSRGPSGVTVSTARGDVFSFDRVVIAVHADEAIGLLEDPSPEEHRLLSPWSYQPNEVILHTDTTVLPPRSRAWACWNYTREYLNGVESPVSVTYYMNELQGLDTQKDYCVSLNRRTPIQEDLCIAGMNYRHPLYTFESMATQKDLPLLNGRKNTYYCGSYFGYGFHEDAVRSAVAVGRCFGRDL